MFLIQMISAYLMADVPVSADREAMQALVNAELESKQATEEVTA